jgi:uncharacterized protein
MLIVPTSVKQSEIAGLGLFAEQYIPKGTVIWKFNPIIDILYTPEDVTNMPEDVRKIITHFAFLSKVSGMYVLPIDNDRFMNHSLNNNIDSVFVEGEKELLGVANRDIQVGEEILTNYTTFDANDAVSEEEYLKK